MEFFTKEFTDMGAISHNRGCTKPNSRKRLLVTLHTFAFCERFISILRSISVPLAPVLNQYFHRFSNIETLLQQHSKIFVET